MTYVLVMTGATVMTLGCDRLSPLRQVDNSVAFRICERLSLSIKVSFGFTTSTNLEVFLRESLKGSTTI